MKIAFSSPEKELAKFDQITQKRLQKNLHDRKKLEDVKMQILPRRGRKGRKIFLQLFRKELKKYLYILRLCIEEKNLN
jgi:hypothetical protein